MRGIVVWLSMLAWVGAVWCGYQVDLPAAAVDEGCLPVLEARLKCFDSPRWWPATSITGPGGHPSSWHLLFQYDEELRGRRVERVEVSAGGESRVWKPGKAEASYTTGSAPAVTGSFRSLKLCAATRPDLLQVEVDPATRAGLIRVLLAKEGMLKLDVLDLLGNPVGSLCRATRPAGVHTFQFVRGAQPAGLYLIKLEVEGRREIRKLLLS